MEISMGGLQEKLSWVFTETIPSKHITSILAYKYFITDLFSVAKLWK